jgi:hypothetical protein
MLVNSKDYKDAITQDLNSINLSYKQNKDDAITDRLSSPLLLIPKNIRSS